MSNYFYLCSRQLDTTVKISILLLFISKLVLEINNNLNRPQIIQCFKNFHRMKTRNYHTIFLIHHLYYLPQLTPIAKELKRRDKSILFLILSLDAKDKVKTTYDYCKENDLNPHLYSEQEQEFQCKFMFNAAHSFPNLNIQYEYSASISHGIGTKAGNYTAELNKHDLRFVEGEQRVRFIKDKFPNANCKVYNVGFAKLDDVFSYSTTDKNELIQSLSLDPGKKTILYAPTFYPSSIEKMSTKFPDDFKNYNIIIKPHFFSFEIKTYRHQVRKFNKWNKFKNVYLAGPEEFNLIPFMTISDLMISDESSAIFEFAALNKPVILNQDVKYRLTYRLFKSKIKKRMEGQMTQYKEVALIINHYKELKPAVKQELSNPENRALQRFEISESIVGKVDGKVSVRIADIIDSL